LQNRFEKNMAEETEEGESWEMQPLSSKGSRVTDSNSLYPTLDDYTEDAGTVDDDDESVEDTTYEPTGTPVFCDPFFALGGISWRDIGSIRDVLTSDLPVTA
jgi:hypothetical protein